MTVLNAQDLAVFLTHEGVLDVSKGDGFKADSENSALIPPKMTGCKGPWSRDAAR